MINKLNKKFAFKIFEKEFCLILRIYLIKIYGNRYAIDIGVLEFFDINIAIEYIYLIYGQFLIVQIMHTYLL